MKTAGMLHTLTGNDPDRWPAAREILTCATRSGHAALRSGGRGTLAVGAPADLVLVDLGTLSFLPLNDLVRQLVHVELGQSVRLTMVAGRILFEDGKIRSVDEASLMEEARAVFSDKGAALARAAQDVAPLLPYYRAMHDRACVTNVGMARKLKDAFA
jgi:cytosine/adenosine deaminase-related metal-dependent hydrolase